MVINTLHPLQSGAKNIREMYSTNHKISNKVMSIMYKIITVLSWLNNSSWPSDDLFILRGLVINTTRRFSVVTSIRNFSTRITTRQFCIVGLLMVGRHFYFALRTKVATMSTLIRLNMFCAFVSITTCLAKDNFESNLLGFILAQNTSPTLKFLRKQHRTPWTMNPVHFDYHSDLLNLLGLVLLT